MRTTTMMMMMMMLCITGNVLSTPTAKGAGHIRDADSSSSSSSSRDAGRRRRRRRKRSHSRERHVEALVAVDVKMRRYHGHNLEHYILTLMAIVTMRFIYLRNRLPVEGGCVYVLQMFFCFFLFFLCFLFFFVRHKYETTVLGNGWTDFHETFTKR